MKDKVKIVSNVWFRQIELQSVGDAMEGHSHTFDHMHLLAVGKVRVTVGDDYKDFTAPSTIFIRKGKEHKIEALSDYSLGFCIHAIREGYRVEDIIEPSDKPYSQQQLKQALIDETHKFIDTPIEPWKVDEHELQSVSK